MALVTDPSGRARTASQASVAARVAVWPLVGLLLSGCLTSGALRAGQQAERAEDFDRAVVEYTRALKESPQSREARTGLERAKLRASLDHFARGRRLASGGRLEEALIELQVAAELNPTNGQLDQQLSEVRAQLRTKIAVAREGKTQLETLIERTRDLAPAGNELPSDAKLPASVTFRDASTRDVYTALARFANINVVFDPQFRDQPVTIDLQNSTLEVALQSVSTATRNFYRMTAQRTVTVIPDTAAKRREYEDEVMRVFYLSNADLKETLDLLRIVVDLRRVAPVAATNALSIKDTPERVAAAGRLISAIDKARPEVVIDVELLEVDRTRLKEYGLQLASPQSPAIGVNGAASVDRDELTVRDVRSLTQANVMLSSLPSLFFRLLKQDSNTRTLANPQLRTSEGIAATARFGEKVPVPVTTFAPIATGGINQQPITSYNYTDIGVNIDITPRMHHDDEVSLALKIEVSSISGTGFGGLPTFGNRSINTVIRLRDGETNLLAGLIRDDERRVVAGVPGLSDIPVVGRLFAHTRRETQETDIVMTLTPRIVRVLELTEEDLRPFRVGRDGDAGGGVIDLPVPAVIPPATPIPLPAAPGGRGGGAAPVAPGPAPQGPVAPIAPPAGR